MAVYSQPPPPLRSSVRLCVIGLVVLGLGLAGGVGLDWMKSKSFASPAPSPASAAVWKFSPVPGAASSAGSSGASALSVPAPASASSAPMSASAVASPVAMSAASVKSSAPTATVATPGDGASTRSSGKVDIDALLRESQKNLDAIRRAEESDKASRAVASATPTPLPSPTPTLGRVVAMLTAGDKPSNIRRVTLREKLVALTFDDGPSPAHTRQLMDVLESHHVPATFFFIGRQVREYPDLVREAERRGFELGNHTQNHRDLHRAKPEVARREIEECQDAFAAAGARLPSLIRFPYGNSTQSLRDFCRSKGLGMVAWNVDTRDWEGSSTPDRVVQTVIRNVSPGSIILMHERDESNSPALPRVIAYLRREGYRTVTVGELLRTAGAEK